MATILKHTQREFKENPGKIDPFRLYSDTSRVKNGINPKNLNFDLRQLNPEQFSAPYHFHHFAEELFMVISGSMTLRTLDGLQVVEAGDLIFFEMGETGAHQFFNHTGEPCTYLDIRTFIGYDLCEYPDSEKVLLAPSFDIYSKNTRVTYFEGDENVAEKWNKLT
jgi:uncharacterized cupin superfamily protein